MINKSDFHSLPQGTFQGGTKLDSGRVEGLAWGKSILKRHQKAAQSADEEQIKKLITT